MSATEIKKNVPKKGFFKKERDFKDKDKPVEIRSSNITAAKGTARNILVPYKVRTRI